MDPPIPPIRPRSRRRTFDRKVRPRPGDREPISPGRACCSCPARASGKIQWPAGTRGIGCATSVLADQLGGFATGSRGFGRRRNSRTLLPSASVIWAPLPGPADDPFRLGIAGRLHLSCSYGGTFSYPLMIIASLFRRFRNSFSDAKPRTDVVCAGSTPHVFSYDSVEEQFPLPISSPSDGLRLFDALLRDGTTDRPQPEAP